MSEMTPALAELKDIHLPEVAPWWALAPGWWLLSALLLVIIVWGTPKLIVWFKRRKSKHLLVLSVKENLEEIQQQYAVHQDEQQLLAAISTLLRRVSLTLFAGDKSAGLVGDDWLKFLDQQWPKAKPELCFESPEVAVLLKEGAYRPATDKNLKKEVAQLVELTKKWSEEMVQQRV